MKKSNKLLKLIMVALSITLLFSACKEEEVPNPPLAFFTYAPDVDNSQLIVFTNETENGKTYLWEFGDGGTSTEMNPSHQYANSGTFTVKLTATNAGGDNFYSEDILVAPTNLVVNGTFDDDSGWTILNLYECTNDRGEVTIANGVATWSEAWAEPDGAWKHMGIYQELTLDAGTYSVDMMVDYADINSIWGELYVGQTIPTACTETVGTDYSDNLVLNFLNGWDCGSTYSGSAVASACKPPADGENGVFTLDAAGTYYFLLKVGGASYGPNGVKVDDIVLYKQ